MARCEVCGNDYELAFQVITAGVTHTFDSFECAVHKLAPICSHCGVKVVGHGIEAKGTFFCCAHCARAEGVEEIVDNAAHVGGAKGRAEQPQMRASDESSHVPHESWRGGGLAEEPDVGGARRGSPEPDDTKTRR